jgi:methylated-DNA-[protein]-cysteine S-methyltransferase
VIAKDQIMALQIASLKTPIGMLNLIADGDILLGANFSSVRALKDALDHIYVGSESKLVKKIPGISPLIADYFEGDLTALSAIKVSQPAGKVISYSQLAEKAGSPKAVRAAGSACAKNAIVLVVPCHRIIKTGGDLGNYAYGVNKKLWLLRHEGVQ